MPAAVQVVCPRCATTNRVARERIEEQPRCGRCKGALFSGRPIELTAATFDAHVGRSGIPVVVDFWASWCGPCQAMAPAFAEATRLLEPRARLAKVDADREAELTHRFGITGIPTLILFKGGRERARRVGAVGTEDLVSWVGEHGNRRNRNGTPG